MFFVQKFHFPIDSVKLNYLLSLTELIFPRIEYLLIFHSRRIFNVFYMIILIRLIEKTLLNIEIKTSQNN